MSPIKCKSSSSDDEKLIAIRALKHQRQERRRWAKQKQAKRKDFIAKTLYIEEELNVQQYSS